MTPFQLKKYEAIHQIVYSVQKVMCVVKNKEAKKKMRKHLRQICKLYDYYSPWHIE